MKRLVGAIVAVGVALYVGAVIGYNLHTPAHVTSNPPTISQLLTLVNAERAKYHVAPLKEDIRLDASAQMKANDEVAYHYFGHISPKASPHAGKNSRDYIFGTGIVCVDSSENLTENISTNSAKSAVNAWVRSTPHHKAMVDPKYDLTGFGIAGDQIVEHFCQSN